jgi:hypothetical protein
MKFKAWLLGQAGRDDQIGDLARIARKYDWRDRVQLLQQMRLYGYDRAAMEVVRAADDEWWAAETGGKIGGERGPDEQSRQADREQIERQGQMATFASWLKGQVSRGDEIGYAAKYWESVTPGKISAVTGVEKYLRQIKADYETQPEGMEEAAWLHGRAQVDAALSGLKFAVDEYHKQQALEVAQAAGAVPKLASVPDPEPPADPGPEMVTPDQLAQAHERATAAHPVERGLAGSGKDLRITAPQDTVWSDPLAAAPSQLDRIEAKLDAIGVQNEIILQFIEELFGRVRAEIDWDALAAMADYAAVTE